MKQFDANTVTVERALKELRAQGFLAAQPRRGTFVASRPPHLYQFGLVFPGHPQAVKTWRWTQHFLAEYLAAQSLTAVGPWRVKPYFDVAAAEGSRGYRALAADLEAGVLAGVIFAYTPHELLETSLWRALRVPVVLPQSGVWPGAIVVRLSREQFFDRAVAWVREQGRRRVAVLSVPSRSPVEIYDSLAASGLSTCVCFTQAVDPFHNTKEWVQHSLQVMLNGHAGEQPDALIITDDHLVEAAVQFLEAGGLRLPEDLLVVGHWNFPLAYRGPIGVQLLGFDAGEWLRRAISLMTESAAAGGTETVIPPRFAAELPYRGLGDAATADQTIERLTKVHHQQEREVQV